MSLIKNILNLFDCNTFIKRVIKDSQATTPREQTDNEMINEALKNLKGYTKRSWQRITLDNQYWTCSKEEFQTIVDYNTINEKQYVLQQFDCDNFAFAF